MDARWIEFDRCLANEVGVFCDVLGREVAGKTVVEKGAFKEEVYEGVEGVPDEEDACPGAGSFWESESRRDVGCDQEAECC